MTQQDEDDSDLFPPEDFDPDVVNYCLYLIDASPTDLALSNTLGACLAAAAPFTEGYIWQKEPFSLSVTPAAGSEPAHLRGRSAYGDAVEDEWFIVFLLRELTRQLPVSARVWDSDGEFLLIEAAYHLPKWASRPDRTEHRVFFHCGEMHLVPPTVERSSGLRATLAAVADSARDTLAPVGVRDAVADALRGFPERARRNMHTARCRVPARVAALLRAEPQLVAPAVSAFYERDPADMSAASKMAAFPPQEMVTVPVRMTRVIFAMLSAQRFDPPKRGFPMPEPSDQGHRAAMLGLKLTVGFEILATEWARAGEPLLPEAAQQPAPAGGDAPPAPVPAPAPSTGAAQGGAATLTAVLEPAHDPAWTAYKHRLETLGYFQGNIPGSKDYRSLLSAAAERYCATEAHQRFLEAARAPAKRAAAVLAACGEGGPARAEFLPEPGPEADDPDDWVYEGEALLSAALESRGAERDAFEAHRQGQGASAASGAQAGGAEGDGDGEAVEAANAQNAAESLRKVTAGLRGFVQQQSTFEGAEVKARGAEADDDGVSDDDSDGGADGGGGAEGAGAFLDPEKFLRELQAALGLEEEGGSDDSMSDDLSSGDEDEEDSDDEVDIPVRERGGAAEPRPSAAFAGSNDAPVGRGAAPLRRRFELDAEDEPDSDDEDGDEGEDGEDEGSLRDYMAAMDAQLRGTAMETSFERRGGDGGGGTGGEGLSGPAAATAAAAAGKGVGAKAKAKAGREGAAAEEGDEEGGLGQDLDLDYNLVKSLLESYSSQAGLAGPASNMLGMLGLGLPDDADKGKGRKQPQPGRGGNEGGGGT